MIVPAVTVSGCLFRGVRGFCVNVRVSLQLFLVSFLVWHLLIIIDGRASSDRLPGPMLVWVHLGDVCVVLGSFLVFLVFCYILIGRKVYHICFITTARRSHTGRGEIQSL